MVNRETRKSKTFFLINYTHRHTHTHTHAKKKEVMENISLRTAVNVI